MKTRLLELAKRIQPHVPSFYLAGGTALMFRYEHRISEDLDFLSARAFSVHRLISKIRKHFTPDSYEVPGERWELGRL